MPSINFNAFMHLTSAWIFLQLMKCWNERKWITKLLSAGLGSETLDVWMKCFLRKNVFVKDINAKLMLRLQTFREVVKLLPRLQTKKDFYDFSWNYFSFLRQGQRVSRRFVSSRNRLRICIDWAQTAEKHRFVLILFVPAKNFDSNLVSNEHKPFVSVDETNP